MDSWSFASTRAVCACGRAAEEGSAVWSALWEREGCIELTSVKLDGLMVDGASGMGIDIGGREAMAAALKVISRCALSVLGELWEKVDIDG